MGANLMITGGMGDQTIEVAVNNGLTVGGNFVVDLADGNDMVDEDANDINVTGDLNFSGVNNFQNNGTMTVGGNVSVDSTADTMDSVFDDDATMTIGGDFVYTGGDGRDEVLLNGLVGGSSIGGSATIDLGDNSVGGTQYVFLNMPGSAVGGSLTVRSNSALNPDSVSMDPTATFGGDIEINLGGGTNTTDMLGVFGGTSVTYRGGSGRDIVAFGMTGNPATVNIVLYGGDDNFTLEAGASIAPTTLRVDFGGGDDMLVNNFGDFTFNATLLNWHDFNRYYTVSNDLWNITQTADTGDVTLDNNGTAGAIRVLNGFVTELTAADNVRLNMFNGGTSNVFVDLDAAFAGDILLDLLQGDRDVSFVGDDNSVGGDLRIFGNAGDQNVYLAVNNDLSVGGVLLVTLRDGYDSVDENGNNITVGGDFILRRVNFFDNDGVLTVGNNFAWNSSTEDVDSTFDNDGTMTVGNQLYYKGGAGLDTVLFNDGVTAGGVGYIDVGDGPGNLAQSISLANGFSVGARMTVTGGNNTLGNFLITDEMTDIGGNFVVDFSASTSPNQAILVGQTDGSYGSYLGGTGDEIVTLNLIGNDMNFVVRLDGGDDTFTLGEFTDVLSLLVDFGDGDDTFIDDIGQPYPFPVTIQNLP